MSFYQAAGGLILGTRLKRLSDRFLQEVGLIYQALDIDFEPSWFPVFFLLQKKESLSMTDIATEMDVSHSAISQMISSLRKKKLIQLIEDPEDARRKKISLTALGQNLLEKVSPVWTSMNLALPTLWGDQDREGRFLEELSSLESRLAQKVFSSKTLALVPELDVELMQLDMTQTHSAFEAFKGESEGRFLDLPESVQVWVILCKGMVVGALAMLPIGDYKLQLWQVFVKMDYRRKGLATALIKSAISTPSRQLDIRLEEPNMPVIQLLIQAKVTFTVSPNNS